MNKNIGVMLVAGAMLCSDASPVYGMRDSIVNPKVVEYAPQNFQEIYRAILAKDWNTVEGELAKLPENVFNSFCNENVIIPFNRPEIQNVFSAAVDGGLYHLCEVLIRKGADINAFIDGYTPLQKALMMAHSDTAKILLKYNADVFKKDAVNRFSAYQYDQTGDPVVARILSWHMFLSKFPQIENKTLKTIFDELGQLPSESLAYVNPKDIMSMISLINWDNETLGNLRSINPVLVRSIALIPENGVTLILGGRTLLHYAAWEGSTDLLEFLISKGVDVNTRDKGEEGYTPLHIALLKKSNDIAKLLLDRGANINIQDNYGNTPLHYAIGNFEMTGILVSRGATIEAPNKHLWTPLHKALDMNLFETAEFLISKGADATAVDAQNRNALAIVLYLHYKDTNMTRFIELLPSKGIDVNAVYNTVSGPGPLLFFGLSANNDRLLRVLKEKEANPNVQFAFKGKTKDVTLLHALVYRDLRTPHAITRAIRDFGANPNIQDSNGETPLHWAARMIYTDAGIALIDAGTDFTIKDSGGRTPLHLAAENGCIELAKALIGKGADINAVDNDGKTPLSYAMSIRNNDKKAAMIELLGGNAH